MTFVDGFLGFIDFLWLTFLLLAPMLLLGLLLSGIMHVFISRNAIVRWFRGDSLKVVAGSAAIGVPMPLCSCSVVPVVAEMRRKGASRSACMSLLITAPETGADSILVTNAFFGPIVAIVRPLVSFLTAVISGLFCIRLTSDETAAKTAGETAVESVSNQVENTHAGQCHEHDHEHRPLHTDRNDCYVSLRDLAVSLRMAVSSRLRKSGVEKGSYSRLRTDLSGNVETHTRENHAARSTLSFGTVIRHVLRYGFVEVADEILFALLVGITLGGVLYFVIPADLMSHEYAYWISYPVMLLIGMPLYICASASTPIAAALVAKGVSPGAALVFLMTGPATNTGTIAIVINQFGTRFAAVYVLGVIVVTVILGIAIDISLIAAGISIAVNLDASESHAILSIQWIGAICLILLILWRFKKGALRSGFDDLVVNLRPAFHRLANVLNRGGT